MGVKRKRFSHLIMPILAGLIFASGCGTAEKATIEEPPVIANTPKVPTVDQSPNHLATPNIETRETDNTKLNTLPTEARVSLNSLIGLNSLEIQTILGLPQFQRLDISAQIWQYRQSDCVLYLFLYPSASGLSVSHLETRDHVNANNSQEKCFAEILRAAHKTPS